MFLSIKERLRTVLEEAVRTAVEGVQRPRRGAMVVALTQDSPDGHTVQAQPGVQGYVTQQDGSKQYQTQPVHMDVPLHMASGGGHTYTHPAKQGDTGLVVYADRCIDAWHAQGGQQPPTDARECDLSDAIHLPGVRNDTNKLANVSQVSAQMRADNGQHFTDVHQDNGVTHQSGNMVLATVGNAASHLLTAGGFKANAPKINLNC